MSVVLSPRRTAPNAGTRCARVALLGSGTVGSALLARLATLPDSPLLLVAAANTRVQLSEASGLCPRAAALALLGDASARSHCGRIAAASSQRPFDVLSGPLLAVAAPGSSALEAVQSAAIPANTDIVIDATASDAIAGQHTAWLARGVHVVTACKLGQGGGLQRWQAIQAACEVGNTSYGDSATVGAGLPVLRTLRELRAGGDRIHAIAGVLSGSLGWLFDTFDGLRPFSTFVGEAQAAGYTEPDPREDLSGQDVRRKLLIVARAAGVLLEPEDIAVESLLTPTLVHAPRDAVAEALRTLDPVMRARFAAAYKRGERLRYVARLDCRSGRAHARVGLESLPHGDPLCGGRGSDNRVAVWSDRYPQQPVVIQGPGAGAEVTAAALLDDALRIARGR